MEPIEEFIQYEDGSHETIGATNNGRPIKFKSLPIDGYYKVIGYAPTFNKSYILNVKDIKNNVEFELYSTNKLTTCINDTNFSKSGGFYFYVRGDSNLSYPEIVDYKTKLENYKPPKRQFITL